MASPSADHSALNVFASSLVTAWSPFGFALVAATCLPLALLCLLPKSKGAVKVSQAGKMDAKKEASAPTEVTMTVDPRRFKEPNFGFGDVRVSKILVHPIKVSIGFKLKVYI